LFVDRTPAGASSLVGVIRVILVEISTTLGTFLTAASLPLAAGQSTEAFLNAVFCFHQKTDDCFVRGEGDVVALFSVGQLLAILFSVAFVVVSLSFRLFTRCPSRFESDFGLISLFGSPFGLELLNSDSRPGPVDSVGQWTPINIAIRCCGSHK